ncbi:flagellin N-terminal helical domain-containing protein [Alkalihalophilus marmarensis]|uniref:flagellin N-terminal helical domain-containing protein n=1 Tax=Alkalihalophilus marmarensis TaxID=521377 RepID=UPI002DBBC0B9|nr:flagellin [Alkalihalophilus marmarensis]MEC2071261.1 flagellin [Alkalihalophilus marmarensis]
MIINNNIPALNTYRQMGANQLGAQKSMEKLASGLRINRAGDDAAGLAISEKMRGQIRGLDQASRNAQDGISLIQTAEGALNETHSILQRMRELAVQSSNDTNTETDRKELQKELDQLTNEIDRIANTTEFNTQKLLNGEKQGLRAEATGTVTLDSNTTSTVTATPATGTDDLSVSGTVIITRTADLGGDLGDDFAIGDPGGLTAALNADGDELTGFGDTLDLTGLANMQVGESVTISVKAHDAGNDDASKAFSFQIGANSGQNILVGIDDMRAEALGVRNSGESLDITNSEKATAAISTINNAIETVSAQRSNLGAFQNRLEHTINNLGTSAENLQAAESRIRDVDMAREVMDMTKNNILSQASQAMLAQANQAPQAVLQLLG